MAIEVIKNKKNTIYRAVFSKNRHRSSKSFARKIDAINWLQNQERLHHYGYKPTIKFAEAARQWLDLHSSIRKAPTSYEQDKRFVEEFISFFDDLNLDQITPERVDAYIQSKMKTKTVKPATINRSLQCLRTILNYFIKKQYLLVNAVSIVGLLPEHEASYDYLSFEETYSFLSHAQVKYQDNRRWVYCLYLLAFNCGMRWGEIAGLQWDRVDFKNKSIIISRSLCKHTRKIRETTKSGRVRYVGINSSLLPELLALHEKRSRETNLVFHQNGLPLDLSNFKRDYFEKDLAQVEIRKIRFHDIRHTFASHFAMNGGSLYDLQKLLGHSAIRITERYAHLSPASVIQKTELVAIDGKLAEVVSLEDRRKADA